MRLDPHTTVESLLIAIPSSALVFHQFGIAEEDNAKKSLQQVCSECKVSLEQFLVAMDKIDWTDESPAVKKLDQS